MYLEELRRLVGNRKLLTVGVRAIIRDEAGAILLQRRGDFGTWGLPAGAMELDESIFEALVREVREETGLLVEPRRLTGIYYESHEDFHHFVFLCRRLDETTEMTLEPAEITNAGYWDPSALPRPISDFTVRRIHDALVGEREVLPVSIIPRRWLE